jgi:hypothetical protein
MEDVFIGGEGMIREKTATRFWQGWRALVWDSGRPKPKGELSRSDKNFYAFREWSAKQLGMAECEWEIYWGHIGREQADRKLIMHGMSGHKWGNHDGD